jgi:hypothetical protein
MNVLISRRSLLLRLNICLVFCGYLTFLNFTGCGARIVVQYNSDIKVTEVPADLDKSLVIETSHINDKLNSDVEVNYLSSRNKIQSITKASGKSDNNNEVTKMTSDALKDVADITDIQHKQSIQKNFERFEKIQISNDHQNESKKLMKNPIIRQKRESSSKLVNNKNSEVPGYLSEYQTPAIDGIRRLDIDVEEEIKKKNHESIKINIKSNYSNNDYAETNPNTAENISKFIKNKILAVVKENQKVNIHDVKSLDVTRSDAKPDNKMIYQEPLKTNLRIGLSTKVINRGNEFIQKENRTSHSINRPLDFDPSLQRSVTIQSNPKVYKELSSSHDDILSKLQFTKMEAIKLQIKIQNNTFLQYLKEQMSQILPNIPKLSENQFLDILNKNISKNNKYQFSEFNTFKEKGLSDKQIEIIKCAQQLVEQKEKQSFFNNISQCIRGLNILNCMRIFIYPLIVENMPEALIQVLPHIPIEINIPELLQGNRNRIKSARQVPIIRFYSKPADPDEIIFDILMEGLLKISPNEDLPSAFNAKNVSWSKYLTCNRLHLLQMTEKFLPENARRGYSDEIFSCITRFEYFSCIKYFSWPAIKQYYTSLPQFPLSDSYLSSLIYPNYPLITFPGFENGVGNLPEIIESDTARIKPEYIIMQIFKKVLKEYSRIATLPTPIHLNLIVKSSSINSEQIVTIHLAEQLLPINLREKYVFNTVQCIGQFDYYNCMKYATWPVLKQFNPSIPNFPNFQDIISNFQNAELPQISNLFNYISQFQLPQFEIPQFQLPDISTFAIPDFSVLFPFISQSSVPSVTVEPPSTDTIIGNNKKNNTALESKIYKILKNTRNSLGATPLSPPTYTNRKVFLFPLMTEEQSKIFALAEGIVPPIARESLIISIYYCLNEKNDFSVCTKTIAWPYIRNYVKELPEFPAEDDTFLEKQKVGINIPITGSGDNFFIMREIEKIFFEGREDAISYIIRSIQLYKPESLNMQKILKILQSIQFNAPEFLNMQTIQYPRIPEFTNILTECQENIIHAAESIIPEQLHQKFYNDILDCVKKNKFVICSRNIIFPSIYQYFQKALSVPYYSITSKEKIFSKVNITDAERIYPIRFEIEVNTEKKGENIITATDRKFMPIFPSNPEAVIFSMIRKVQISNLSHPDFPKVYITNSPKFIRAFSIRQIYILAAAEGTLPDEYRKEILDEMYECNQKESFLNCTHDIIFPVLSKIYPDFPDFPNFEKDLNQLNMVSIINNLNKPSSSPRSYKPKRTLPFIEILYKFVPEDKSDVLRSLIDKLPDILYYDLYIKMAQCIQFSDVISCAHDIIYPILKHYYLTPKFNVDKYYPIKLEASFNSAGHRSLFYYEVICKNMDFICNLKLLGLYDNESSLSSKLLPINYEAYIPFGKLSDGSRVFKRIIDIWNTNISSVGEHYLL